MTLQSLCTISSMVTEALTNIYTTRLMEKKFSLTWQGPNAVAMNERYRACRRDGQRTKESRSAEEQKQCVMSLPASSLSANTESKQPTDGTLVFAGFGYQTHTRTYTVKGPTPDVGFGENAATSQKNIQVTMWCR
jgi:hypothetical protein